MSDSHGLISQMIKLTTTVKPMASPRLTSPLDTNTAITRPNTMAMSIPRVIVEAKNSRNIRMAPSERREAS
jgi:hypothetical protein